MERKLAVLKGRLASCDASPPVCASCDAGVRVVRSTPPTSPARTPATFPLAASADLLPPSIARVGPLDPPLPCYRKRESAHTQFCTMLPGHSVPSPWQARPPTGSPRYGPADVSSVPAGRPGVGVVVHGEAAAARTDRVPRARRARPSWRWPAAPGAARRRH